MSKGKVAPCHSGKRRGLLAPRTSLAAKGETAESTYKGGDVEDLVLDGLGHVDDEAARSVRLLHGSLGL